MSDAETLRLREFRHQQRNWKRWGAYLSERAWGTVREDYSADGDCWSYFPHDHARSRVYRWGEDGLLGLCDNECRLCFSTALWNGRDPILKERLFGLSNHEGNHGEDIKECHYYLDGAPTHSYLKALYKYPQAEFPYQHLVDESARRSRQDREYELLDTGVFDQDRYFDLLVEYAKASPDDILIRLTATNHGPDAATLHLLPSLWFRNTWSWGRRQESYWSKPRLELMAADTLRATHESLGVYRLAAAVASDGARPTWLFTENETNDTRLFGSPNRSAFVKDAFHEWLVAGRADAVNPQAIGTKAAAHYTHTLAPGARVVVKLRLTADAEATSQPFAAFDQVFVDRQAEADAFYAERSRHEHSDAERQVSRQAYAGLVWSQQFYEYIVKDWLEGDPGQPEPPPARLVGRNHDWAHMYCRDVISMPDKWEYPWFAAWDNAFHMTALARIDDDFAKAQLVLFLREWYMRADGQSPAYEFNFADVNPPVHAWAALRVYQMSGPRGKRDRHFLARVFQKLLINFTWWVNRKDLSGKNLFGGGFLGMDNIGVFDRSHTLPPGMLLTEADGTAWMAFYCLTMLAIALELARDDIAYEDMASKFFEHFVTIADAMNNVGGGGLWDEEDGFYYDAVQVGERWTRLRSRSIVGIIPLFAVGVLEDSLIDRLPNFKKRLNWFLVNRPELAGQLAYMARQEKAGQGLRLLAIPSRERLLRVLRYLLDENELLSPFGVRSMSRYHAEHPFELKVPFGEFRVDYEPCESTTSMFGGNSNWRGPIWFPVNYLLVESLRRYHHFYGDDFKIECPTGSGQMMNLMQVSNELASRLTRLFLQDERGHRACHGGDDRYAKDAWRDLILFYEYFDPETGRGCGANHQTGWTAMIARLLEKHRAGMFD